MKKTLEELIYFSIHYHNILPLTSVCNMKCVFCSHQFNPPQLEIYSLPPRSLEEIGDLIDFLDDEKKIVIGESVTRIIEGEPFAHPNILKILGLIRERYPKTPLQITTNGSFLEEKMVQALKSLLPLEFNFSLNSATVEGRKLLMSDKRPERGIKAVVFLKNHGLPFHGSIVAMPMLTGWDDLRKTIYYLSEQGARTIRVFLPGYTEYNLPSWSFPSSLWQELNFFIQELSNQIETPLILEPCLLNNLEAQIEGVILQSPAWEAGIRRGDLILKVNGVRVRSRVEAFELVSAAKDPNLLLNRNGKEFTVVIRKEATEAGGLVLAYDLDLSVLDQWQEAARRHRAVSALLLTSSLAKGIVEAALPLLDGRGTEWKVAKVSNKFLGGSIVSGGLLMVEDLKKFLREWLTVNNSPDLVLLSSRSFDPWGRDLMGRSYLELEEEFNLKVELIFS